MSFVARPLHPDRRFKPTELVPDLAGALRRTLQAHPVFFLWAATRMHTSIRSGHDLACLIDDTAHAATTALPAAQWAGITLRFDDQPFTAATTDPVVLEVDAAQYAHDDGPCLRALRTGHLVHANPAQLRTEWPTLARDAAAAGVVSILAAPIGTEPAGPDRDGTRPVGTGLGPGGPRGSINLYSARPTGFTDDETDLALILAGLLSRGLTEYTAASAADTAHTETQQLQQAMSSRAIIEQAKGILMAVHQVTATDAFAQLVHESNDHNRKVRDVAADFVTAHTTHPGTAGNPAAYTPSTE